MVRGFLPFRDTTKRVAVQLPGPEQAGVPSNCQESNCMREKAGG